MQKIFNYTRLNLEINKYLDANNTTFKMLANKIGLSDRKLKTILNNKNEFDIEHIYKLQSILNINPNNIKQVFFDAI